MLLYCSTSIPLSLLDIKIYKAKWALIAFNILIILGLIQLLLYHIYFNYRGISTYTYLSFKRETTEKKY